VARYFLTRIAVEGFRGINNENDPLNISFLPTAVNSVFAVNGIGKSSIFEALYYAIHGSIPKLQLLHAQERPQEYYCNRFHSQTCATIFLEFQPDDGGSTVSILIKRDAAGNRTVSSPSGYHSPERFLSTLNEAFVLLDYRTFSSFIEESPLARGRTFSTLLGLSDYSDCRQSFQAASDSRTLNSDFDTRGLAAGMEAHQRSVQQALASLRLSYQSVTGKSFEDTQKLDEYINEVTTSLGNVELLMPYFTDKALADINFDEIKVEIKNAEGGEKRQDLEKVVQTIAALEVLTSFDLQTIDAEQQQIERLLVEREALFSATRGNIFKRLYEAANELVSTGIWAFDNKCPLCESDIQTSISEQINELLNQYKAAADKIREINELWQSSEWKKFIIAFETTRQLGIPLNERTHASLEVNFTSGNITRGDLTAAIQWTSVNAAKITSLYEAAQAEKIILEKELPASLVQLTEQVEYGRQFKEALRLYHDNQSKEANLQARIDIRRRWGKFILQATSLFADSESTLSQTRISGIDTDYKSMFAEIMKVDDVVPDLLRVNEREDLHVQLSDFHGQHRLSARALLSESFRNALAISVFLAAAMKHSGTPRFVVLDDITSSFDAGHQFFLMELIRTKLQQPKNPDGLQFIILSHDSLLEKYFDRLSSSTDWCHNRLQGSPPLGSVLHQAQGADHLRSTITSLLSAGQISQAGHLIRQYLEYKLQQIIRHVDIPVPIDFAIKDTSRMVQNCLDAILAAIDLHKRAHDIILDPQQIADIDNTYVPAIVGNWVSHYETGSCGSLSASTLGGVVSSIDAFVDCFKYDDNSRGSTVRRWYKSLSRR